MANTLKVGIVGLGSMGSTHLDIYSKGRITWIRNLLQLKDLKI